MVVMGRRILQVHRRIWNVKDTKGRACLAAHHTRPMSPSLNPLLLSAIALAVVAQADLFPLPPGYHRYAPRSQGISWEACGSDDAPRDCARFEVPLDWHNDAAGKASLAVARYNATKQPKIGTLFVNPGGPGSSCQITI